MDFIKVHLNVPIKLFNKMEKVVLQRNLTRTAFIITAIKSFLESKPHAKKPDPDTS